MIFTSERKLANWSGSTSLLLLFFFSKISVAQNDSSKAIRQAIRVCESLVQKNKLANAIQCFEKIQTTSTDFAISIRLAELNYKLHDSSKTLASAYKAIQQNANASYASLMYLCNKIKSNNDDDLAIQIMSRMEQAATDLEQKEKISNRKQSLILKSYADKTPVAGIELKNLGNKINTFEHEYLPSTSLDGEILIFTRNAGGNEDFFISLKDSLGHWIQSYNVGYPPNTNLPDGGAKLSGDGHYLFYTRCDMRSPNGIVGGGCDLAFSYKENGIWSSPQYFGFTLNTTGYEGQPCLSIDNVDLYFVSNRAGGFGGKDIWVSHFKNKFWSEPENLGSNINTAKDETAPFIHADNETLYFSSDGHASIGLSDLFISRKNKNGSWRKPINLGAPINTEQQDGSIIVSANGKIGYCTSERANGLGGLDLYSFNLYPAIQPIPTLCFQGEVIDKFTKQHLKGLQIEFKEYPTQQLLATQSSNIGDASFSQALQKGRNYLVHVESEGYRDFNKIIYLNNDTTGDIINKSIRLRKIGITDTLYKTTLMFQPDELKLESASIQKLDTVLKKWKNWNDDSSRVTILIKGNYYCCDSLTDTFYLKRLQYCQAQLNHISNIFAKRKITCDWVMQDLDIIIYNDDEDLLNEVELTVIENY
jgi:hypothetical protein